MATRDELLRHLETLDHNARTSHMVDVGRRAAADPAVAAVIRELESGTAYERRLAAQSCHGSRDGAHVLRALRDPSILVAGLAAKLTAVVCDDAQAREAVDAAAPADRPALLAQLAARNRHGPIDAFLDEAVGGGAAPADFARLLPFGSAACVGRHMPAFVAADDLLAWPRLARHHPAAAAAAIESLTAAAGQLDARHVERARVVVAALADRRPDLAIDLVRLIARHAPIHQLELSSLARRRPDDVADLVLSAEGPFGVLFDRVVRGLSPDRLTALAARRPNALGPPQGWLKRLPPNRRAEFYAAHHRGWRGGGGVIDPALVALLPGEIREAEGRRHLALPALSTRPAKRLPYASFLPWDEAVAALNAAVRSPDPDLRVAAVAAVVGTARFHPDRLADALVFVLARRNEQDPVRLAAITALAALPPGRWKAEHLDAVGQVIRQALDAADLSHATASAAEKLATQLLPFHAEWAAGWVATLVKERGQVNLFGLEHRLTDADVRRLAPVLLPVLESWETRERRPQLIAAARALGRRLKAFDGLADLLVLVVRGGESWTSEQALDVLYEHRRDRIPRLMPVLVGVDPSWATRQTVYLYLHLRAQTLLTPFLGRQAYSGRFSTGRTRFVLPLESGFFRWTPTQQATFAKTLDEMTRDAARDTPTVLTAINQLSALPDVPPDRLTGLAAAANKKQAVREAAIRALGRLDAGRGLPALLEALGDDRARIAIYALRRELLSMPAAGALAVLRRVPTDKVTVAKEVVRLLGDLGTADAWADLMAMGDPAGPPLHRDVRVALLRALWGHLDRPQTWDRLNAAAADPDPDVAAGVVRIPTDRLSPDGNRRLSALLAKLLDHADAKLRLDVLERIAQLPVSDADRVLLPPLLRCVGSAAIDESTAAASAVFATYAGRESAHVGEAVGRLLPNRRAVRTLVDALQSRLVYDGALLLPTARAVVAALAADPVAATVRAALAGRALPPAELVGVLEAMAAAGHLHADAVAAVVGATGSLGFWPDDRWDTAATLLAAHPDERLRRLAVAALTAAARSADGWVDRRLALLETLRADASPLVAGAAQFTFTDVGPEDEGGKAELDAIDEWEDEE